MSNEPFFKSQADIHAWLNEERGVRKVRHVVYREWVVGYTLDGAMFNYGKNAPTSTALMIPRVWQPVSTTVPWYERPEAIGALVWVWNEEPMAGDDSEILRCFHYKKDGKFYIFGTEIVGWKYAQPLTPDEVRELLAKAEALVEKSDDTATILTEIQKKERPVFKCVVDGKDDPFDTCTWDDGNINDCAYSAQGIKKKDCTYWKAI